MRMSNLLKDGAGTQIHTHRHTHAPGLHYDGLAGRLCVNGDLIGSEMSYHSDPACVPE